jgi:hypothetical protein
METFLSILSIGAACEAYANLVMLPYHEIPIVDWLQSLQCSVVAKFYLF